MEKDKKDGQERKSLDLMFISLTIHFYAVTTYRYLSLVHNNIGTFNVKYSFILFTLKTILKYDDSIHLILK